MMELFRAESANFVKLSFKWFYLFSREEAQEFVDIGALNGLFVLGRSMGFIGKLSRSHQQIGWLMKFW